MIKLITHIIIFSLFVQSFQSVGIIINFKLNQDYIIKILCINKDNPETGCNGKCHLKNQLKKQASEPDKPATTSQFKEIQLYAQANKKVEKKLQPIFHPKTKVVCNKKIAIGYQQEIFHPPKQL